MSSYRKILYHLVFRTKDSLATLNQEHSGDLYAYMTGLIKNKDCFPYRINGVENHMHILSDLHPSIALQDFMRDLKTSSSIWIKRSGNFPEFKGWSAGYAALTYAWKDKDMICNYIKNQQVHHLKESFEDELWRLLREHGIEIDEKYFP